MTLRKYPPNLIPIIRVLYYFAGISRRGGGGDSLRGSRAVGTPGILSRILREILNAPGIITILIISIFLKVYNH